MIGHRFELAQVNLSVSAAGVLRGVHFADTPPGQAKYVYCPRGALLDVVAGALDIGVKHLSTYAFSTENWRRSPEEVRFLMGFTRTVLRAQDRRALIPVLRATGVIGIVYALTFTLGVLL